MKQLILTKAGGRILELNVSGKAEGFNPRDSRKWTKIADKILTAIDDYDAPIQALIEEAQSSTDRHLSATEREELIRRINAEIKDLDETVGQDDVTVVFEAEDFSFITNIWWECKFPADRRTRAMTGAVSDALDAAIDVTVEDGKVVPLVTPCTVSKPSRKLTRVTPRKV